MKTPKKDSQTLSRKVSSRSLGSRSDDWNLRLSKAIQ
jgi:hypothetical protein